MNDSPHPIFIRSCCCPDPHCQFAPGDGKPFPPSSPISYNNHNNNNHHHYAGFINHYNNNNNNNGSSLARSPFRYREIDNIAYLHLNRLRAKSHHHHHLYVGGGRSTGSRATDEISSQGGDTIVNYNLNNNTNTTTNNNNNDDNNTLTPTATTSMDGDTTDCSSGRFFSAINNIGGPIGSSSHRGSVTGSSGTYVTRSPRDNKTLTKNRKSESCFDLIGDSRYADNHVGETNGRPMPALRRHVSGSMASSSRDTWTSPPTHRAPAQRSPPMHVRQPCSRNHNHDDNNKITSAYLTPLQRKERELKQIKKEIAKLVDEVDERDSLILSLKYEMDSDTRSLREETDRKLLLLEEALKESDRDREEKGEEVKRLKARLAETTETLERVKLEREQEKEQFKDKYLDMYIKGQKAAKFEREEELEMLASKRKERVTARELARKLSRSEAELARWQTIRRQEAYNTPSKPESSAEATLSFLKDSFYHFVTDPLNCLHHFRAMVEIFKYSDEQIIAIRKSIEESKELKKILKRDR